MNVRKVEECPCQTALIKYNLLTHTCSQHMAASVACDCADKLKTKTGTRFYEVLAPYFNQVRHLG